MAHTLYMFSRDVDVSHEIYRQTIGVYAKNSSDAELLLREHLADCQTKPGKEPVDVEAAYVSSDGWRAFTVELDKPKIVSSLLTR